MLADLTAAKIDHALASLALDQLTNPAAPLPGEVTRTELARRAGVSEATLLKLERIALAKVQAGLLSSGLDAHILRRFQS